MALCEILTFAGIPIKVSINEYIDISKDYSTPKSKVFINGVIDNLVADLKARGEVKKSGRGLIE
jgi:N utilization substance protein B